MVKRVLGWGPEQREPNTAVLYSLIIMILISYIIIKLLIMENHPSRNGKRNSYFKSCINKSDSYISFMKKRLFGGPMRIDWPLEKGQTFWQNSSEKNFQLLKIDMKSLKTFITLIV